MTHLPSRASDIDPSTLARAKTLLLRLELVSHGGTQNLNPQGKAAERSALFPPGGIARKDDREDPETPLWRAYSHLHFKPRLANARTTEVVELLIGEMEDALRAWTHTGMPPRDSQAWKERIANEPGHVEDVARTWGVKKTYVWQLRRQFGTGGHWRRNEKAA